MTLPVYEHHLTVDGITITPRGPLFCGTAGDKHAARLTVVRLDERYHYRVEIVNGAGEYDISERLTVQDAEAAITIPAAWTAAGTAAVRLVQFEEQDGAETARRYYPPVLLSFAYRDEGSKPATAEPLWQEQITRAETLLNELTVTAAEARQAVETAKEATDAAKQAENAAQAAAQAAQVAEPYAVRAETAAKAAEDSAEDCGNVLTEVQELSGIANDIEQLTGEGGGIWHPCVTVDTTLDTASDNPVANTAVANALTGKADASHAHTTDDIRAGGYTWGKSDTVEDALVSIGEELTGVGAQISGLEDSINALDALKADKTSMTAETIEFQYASSGGKEITNVADALKLALGLLGV